MRRPSLTAVALLLAPAAPAASQEGTPDLVGQDAPEIETREWLNTDGRTRLADFAGEVVLVEAFATWCGPCVGMMPHLSELANEYGGKGLNVLSITQEPRETVLQFLAQLNVADIGYTIGAGGGTGGYKTTGIPHGWLVGADGKVVWQGHPGGLTSKILEAELRKVEKPTPETLEAKAGKSLEYANGLVEADRHLEATVVLDKIVAKYEGTPTAKRAAARKAELESDPEIAADLDAQRAIAKLLGGPEMPKEKLKSRQRKSLASKLEGLIRKYEGQNEGAAALARAWHQALTVDWSVSR